MDLNLERIIRFCVVAEEMSFTRASQRLRVDQPWLSRQVQQLEAQLGFTLFERTTRRIALTKEGELFLTAARDLADAAERTRSVARSLSQERRQVLRLGVSRATFWLSARGALIETFSDRYPNTSVEVIGGLSPRILRALEGRKLDAGIIAIAEGIEGFDYLPLYRNRPTLMVPQEHELATLPELRMSDLKGIELITPMRDGNPLSFDLEYEPFFHAGVVPHRIPEGRAAAHHYATAERRFMLGRAGEKEAPASFVCREVVDTEARVEIGAVRNREDDREVVRKFWSAAQIVSKAAALTHAVSLSPVA